jgi:D-beta-D-heptose 7-phosphate kinase/D-beta-D-heptose 1-phosphate adenosyltransferase
MSPKTTPNRHATPERWSSLLEAFAGRRVLVVGDVILDRYLWGDVERTSPEAPVPVVRLRRETATLGGAANVIANLAGGGAVCGLLGVVGDDADAELLRARLAECGVMQADLIVDRTRPTITKTRVVCQNQQLLRMDREQDAALGAAVARRLLARFGRLVKRAELVIFSDYGKGVLAPELCQAMLAQARGAGKRVIVDPKGSDYSKYRGAAVITPNLKEAQAAAGIAIDSPETLAQAARALQATVRGEAVLITRGAHGVALFPRRGKPDLVPAQALAVYDVTGAGDSLIATFSLALAAGATPAEAARLGNAAGSIVVSKLGAATLTRAELLAALTPGAAGHKLRTAAQLREELAPLRAAGRQIVFTNGCFDLLHLGHIKFLQQARRLGDVLVVALNTDRSVRAVKGAPRPVLSEAERAGILSSLEAVDYIVFFDEDTPEALLELLRPDVLVKGKGLRAEEVVGRAIVKRHGGKIALLPLLGDTTTAQVVERLAHA